MKGKKIGKKVRIFLGYFYFSIEANENKLDLYLIYQQKEWLKQVLENRMT